MFVLPLVSKEALINTSQPGLPLVSDAPLRTLKRNHVVSDGVRFQMRGQSGKVAGQLVVYSRINQIAARLERLGYHEDALDCQAKARTIEASDTAKQLVKAFKEVIHPQNLSDPHAVYVYALTENHFKQIVIELAKQTDEAIASLALPEVFEQVVAEVYRVDEFMAHLKTTSGAPIAVFRQTLAAIDCDTVGRLVSVETEAVKGNLLISVAPAIADSVIIGTPIAGSAREKPKSIRSKQARYNLVKEKVSLPDYVKDHLGIDLIASSGSSKALKACCPFHEETTPSFKVMPSDAGWYYWRCFGACDQGGSIIDLVMTDLNISANEAVDHLIKTFDLEETPFARFQNQVKKLTEIKTKAQQELARDQAGSKIAVDAFANQGISKATLESFEIGLDIKKRRAVIPIKDQAGNIVSLATKALFKEFPCQVCNTKVSAKTMATRKHKEQYDLSRGIKVQEDWRSCPHCGAKASKAKIDWLAQQFPAYVFSMNFEKSQLLYNEVKARKALFANAKGLYLFEGFADVWAASEAGVDSSVAYLGAVLSPKQAERAVKLANASKLPIVLVPDWDGVGTASTNRSRDLLLAAGADKVFTVSKPRTGEKDIGEVLRSQGPLATKQLLEEITRLK